MYSKAVWKYYLDINMYNIPFSLIFGFVFGIIWNIIIFSSFGVLIGYLGYQTFKKNEYYTYYNLGFTKVNLIKRVWLINMLISSLILLIFMIFK